MLSGTNLLFNVYDPTTQADKKKTTIPNLSDSPIPDYSQNVLSEHYGPREPLACAMFGEYEPSDLLGGPSPAQNLSHENSSPYSPTPQKQPNNNTQLPRYSDEIITSNALKSVNLFPISDDDAPKCIPSTDSNEDQFEYPTTPEAPTANLFPPVQQYEDSIFVYLLLTFPDDVSQDIWNYIDTSLFVSTSLPDEQNDQPLSSNSVFCYQQSTEISPSGLGNARDISARITINKNLQLPSTKYLFQLFLAISEKGLTYIPGFPTWNKLDVIAFIHIPETGQLLRPIGRDILQKEVCANKDGFFLGSFYFHENSISHNVPSVEALIQREENENNNYILPQTAQANEEVVIVDRNDMILEANGAHAGRPMHKRTKQRLMTTSQVEKFLEIRTRWLGLSSRQRRSYVSESDLYTLLTLNRDETAKGLGVCTTWLKDEIRMQGIKKWPGRPLRRTGAMLQTLKENLESARAALKFSDPAIGETRRYEEEIQGYENEIKGHLKVRLGILKKIVSEKYFRKFLAADGKKFLNPDWNALPPFVMPTEEA